MGYFKLITICLILILNSIDFYKCDVNPEPQQVDKKKANSVLVHFMDLKRTEFIELLPNLKTSIANSLIDFCTNETTANCGENKKFNSDNIKFYGLTDKEKFVEDGRYVITNLYVETQNNEGSEHESNVLPKETTFNFMKSYRSDIVKNGKVEIAYVENELVYPPRDNLDNYIIVSVSCAFCIILVVINLICQRKISKEEKKQFLSKAKELKPLLNTSKLDNSIDKRNYTPSIHSETSDLRKQNVIIRQTSFDQKLDVKTGGKRKRKNLKTSDSVIAGNVGSGIGSPRNIAENLDDNTWDNDISNIKRTNEYRKPRSLNNSNYSINRNGEIQIPIHRLDNKRNFMKEYSDPRVAYRLASNENLF